MLAIVIPYYKISFFGKTLESLAQQTNKDFNVYIGDDASPQDSKDLLKIYKQELNITYLKFKNNLGSKSLTQQWDRCIEMTNEEEWIMVLGDDDFISENYVEEFYKNLEKINEMNIQVVRYASREIIEETGEVSQLYTHPEIEKSTDFFFRKFIARSTRGSLTEQIFKREAYLKFGFRDFPLGWGADNFAWLEFTQFGKVFSINNATAYFRISNENISRWGFKQDLKQEARFQYFSLLIEDHLDKFKKEQRLLLLNFYEQVAESINKSSFSYFKSIGLKYFKVGNFQAFLSFCGRFLKYHGKRFKKKFVQKLRF